MKKFTMFLMTGLFTSVGMAQTKELSNEERIKWLEQRRMDDAIMLSTAIKMPLVSQSELITAPLFATNGVYQVNEFHLKIHISPVDSAVDSAVLLEVYSNGKIIASGQLFERTTFDDARTALIFELLNNSMMREVLAKSYKVLINGVGDFSVVRTARNSSEEIVDRTDGVYFIRGAKAISLCGVNGTVDVWPIAKALDELLKNPPAKPTDKKPVPEVKK